jgi:hypothetical protein
MSEPEAGVSEVARVLASIAAALPAATRQQLSALLSHSIAAPTHSQIRARRLGLVCELVSAPGKLSVEDYTRLRAQRAAEDWPAASTLIEHFGSWPTVLGLALRLQIEGHGSHPIRSSHRSLGTPRGGAYSREEVMIAIQRAGGVVGGIPSLSEYLEIRRVLAAHALLTGNQRPRLPDKHVITRLFDSYRDAARATARWAQT